jgi:hypothetical protein
MSFAQLCNDALLQAQRDASPFTPSRAQLEQSLRPVLSAVRAQQDHQAFIRETFAPVGLMPLAVALYKQELLGDAA